MYLPEDSCSGGHGEAEGLLPDVSEWGSGGLDRPTRRIPRLGRAIACRGFPRTRLNQPVAGCRGKELRRATTDSLTCARLAFRSDIRSRPTIHSSGFAQPRDGRLRLPQALRKTTRNRRCVRGDYSIPLVRSDQPPRTRARRFRERDRCRRDLNTRCPG